MCNWLAYFNNFSAQGMYNGKFAQQVLNNVKPGRCPGKFCRSKKLSYQDMHPHGRMTRHLCQKCYNTLFHRTNYSCVVCGSDISRKLHLQQGNWREIRNHICDDQNCLALWALIHACVIGEAQKLSKVHGQNSISQTPVQQMLQHAGQKQYSQDAGQAYQPSDQQVMNGLPQYQRNAMRWGDYFEDSSCDPYAMARQGPRRWENNPDEGRKVKVINLPKS